MVIWDLSGIRFAYLLSAFFSLGCMTSDVILFADTPDAEIDTTLIVLAGDSTVTDAAGWGLGFQELLNSRAKCVNLAAGGRSSRSFRTEGRWKKCLDLQPDYVFIQFGHNDQPGKGPERETDPETSYREFMTNYVREAREIGAQPILVTSLTRRRFDENGKIQSTLVPYAKVVKEIGHEQGVPVVDLHALSLALCEKLGPAGCEKISPESKNGTDRTHLNAQGARLIAPLIAAELLKVAPEFGILLKSQQHP